MLNQPLAFVDLETTGGSFTRDRIIEIGILRVENSQVVAHYNQLINPVTHLPPSITSLTGITPEELDPAPTFAQVHQEVSQLLEGTLFIAHNARFDYGFLKAECKREDHTFQAQTLCTARLSRLLYPRFRHHNLDSLINRHGFVVNHRHRAFDDAKVLWDFIQLITTTFDPDILQASLKSILQHPSLPANIPKNTIKQLPQSPGVYRFYNEEGTPLYVGKSVNIRHRVRSHFAASSTSSRELTLASQTHHIDAIETAGNLGAQLLESQLIKDLQPIFNRKLRRIQELVCLTRTTTPDGYDRLELTRTPPPEPGAVANFLSFFRSMRQAKATLQSLVTDHQLCPKLTSLESGSGPCFAYHLGDCRGACIGQEPPLRYHLRLASALTDIRLLPWPFPGPIQVTEASIGRTDVHIFHHWCHLGSLSDVADAPLTHLHAKPFDMDTYRILLRYLKQPQHHRTITHLEKIPFELSTDFVIS